MKTKYKNLFLIFLISFQNIFFFLITYLNYDSMRGTDFDRYRKYLDYFVKSDIQKIGLESGVGYFYYISKFFEILSKPILISSIYVEPVYSLSIQLGNFLLLIIGLVGIYYLFDYLQIDKTLNLACLSFLSVFPPVLGARLILKPEILAVSLLPWLILFYFNYFERKRLIYLIFASPILLSLSVLKSSISFMIALTIILLFQKDLLTKKFLIFHVSLIPILYALLQENYIVNGNYLWEHVINENYLNSANLSYIFSFSFNEIINNPLRNNLSNSMISIIFADTFNDYWQRYWYHQDGWSGKNYPGNLTYIRFSIIFSAIFYVLAIYFLKNEKNKKLKYLGSLGFVGVLALIINAVNLFPFFTENFNPAKGDPMKTHLFSFLIIFTFYYVLTKSINIHKLLYYLVVFVIFNSYIFTMISPVETSRYKETFFLNKLHVATPCLLNDGLNNRVQFSDNWCTQEDFSMSICNGSYDKSLKPYQKDDYLIYENDPLFNDRNLTNGKLTVTVGNFYECKNYVDGGYFVPSAEIFQNSYLNEQKLLWNKLIFILSFASVFGYFCLFIFDKKKTII
mgnify:CR=1 FL=1